MEIKPSTWFTFGVDEGLSGYLTRHNLAIVYRDQGRVADAEVQWRQALAEQPQYTPALQGLGELFVVQRRWPDLEAICLGLDTSVGGRLDAAVLRARGHMGRQEYDQTRAILQAVIEEQPLFLWPRVILSRCLLEEGKDPTLAEQVLRGILQLSPEHREAKRSLAKLLEDHPQITPITPI